MASQIDDVVKKAGQAEQGRIRPVFGKLVADRVVGRWQSIDLSVHVGEYAISRDDVRLDY